MITEEDFLIDVLVREMKKPEIGAIVTFLGVVREEGGIKGWRWKYIEKWRRKSWRNWSEKL